MTLLLSHFSVEETETWRGYRDTWGHLAGEWLTQHSNPIPGPNPHYYSDLAASELEENIGSPQECHPPGER